METILPLHREQLKRTSSVRYSVALIASRLQPFGIAPPAHWERGREVRERPEEAGSEAGSVNLTLMTPDAIKGNSHCAELRRLEEVPSCVLKQAGNNALKQQRDFDGDGNPAVDFSMIRLKNCVSCPCRSSWACCWPQQPAPKETCTIRVRGPSHNK